MPCSYRNGNTSGPLYDSSGNICNSGLSTQTKNLLIGSCSVLAAFLLALTTLLLIRRHRHLSRLRNPALTSAYSVPQRPLSAWGRPEVLVSQRRDSVWNERRGSRALVGPHRDHRGSFMGGARLNRESSPAGSGRSLLIPGSPGTGPGSERDENERMENMIGFEGSPTFSMSKKAFDRASVQGPRDGTQRTSTRVSFIQPGGLMPAMMNGNARHSIVPPSPAAGISPPSATGMMTGESLLPRRYSRTNESHANASPSPASPLPLLKIDTAHANATQQPSAFTLFRSNSTGTPTTPSTASTTSSPGSINDNLLLTPTGAFLDTFTTPAGQALAPSWTTAIKFKEEDGLPSITEGRPSLEEILNDETDAELRRWRSSRDVGLGGRELPPLASPTSEYAIGTGTGTKSRSRPTSQFLESPVFYPHNNAVAPVVNKRASCIELGPEVEVLKKQHGMDVGGKEVYNPGLGLGLGSDYVEDAQRFGYKVEETKKARRGSRYLGA